LIIYRPALPAPNKGISMSNVIDINKIQRKKVDEDLLSIKIVVEDPHTKIEHTTDLLKIIKVVKNPETIKDLDPDMMVAIIRQWMQNRK
jgi:hypothetical protein